MLLDLVSGLDSAADAVGGGARQYRAWVPGVVIALEELGVPLPLPGDVLVAYLGYRLATGTMSLAEIVPQLLIGIAVGSMVLFAASQRWGQRMIERYGYIWHLTPRRRRRAERLADRWGFWSVAIGRHVGLRVPMTLMAGAFGMRRRAFTQSVMASSIAWLAVWLVIGAQAGGRARNLLRQVSYGGVAAALALYLVVFILPPLVHVVRERRRRARAGHPIPPRGGTGVPGSTAPKELK